MNGAVKWSWGSYDSYWHAAPSHSFHTDSGLIVASLDVQADLVLAVLASLDVHLVLAGLAFLDVQVVVLACLDVQAVVLAFLDDRTVLACLDVRKAVLAFLDVQKTGLAFLDDLEIGLAYQDALAFLDVQKTVPAFLDVPEVPVQALLACLDVPAGLASLDVVLPSVQASYFWDPFDRVPLDQAPLV